jgi:hypothetical protein
VWARPGLLRREGRGPTAWLNVTKRPINILVVGLGTARGMGCGAPEPILWPDNRSGGAEAHSLSLCLAREDTWTDADRDRTDLAIGLAVGSPLPCGPPAGRGVRQDGAARKTNLRPRGHMAHSTSTQYPRPAAPRARVENAYRRRRAAATRRHDRKGGDPGIRPGTGPVASPATADTAPPRTDRRPR